MRCTDPRLAKVGNQQVDDRADMTTVEQRRLAAMPLHAITERCGKRNAIQRHAIRRVGA